MLKYQYFPASGGTRGHGVKSSPATSNPSPAAKLKEPPVGRLFQLNTQREYKIKSPLIRLRWNLVILGGLHLCRSQIHFLLLHRQERLVLSAAFQYQSIDLCDYLSIIDIEMCESNLACNIEMCVSLRREPAEKCGGALCYTEKSNRILRTI